MLHQLGFPAIISFAVMSLASAKNTLQFMLQKRIIKTKENSPCSFFFFTSLSLITLSNFLV
jgi:hypothetical protein